MLRLQIRIRIGTHIPARQKLHNHMLQIHEVHLVHRRWRRLGLCTDNSAAHWALV